MYKIVENNLLNTIINIPLFIWQLPQIVCGLIAIVLFGKQDKEIYTNYKNSMTVLNINKGYILQYACWSLGPIIFTTPVCSDEIKRHETGHSKQSLYLGPLYLFAIAIPSAILYLYCKLSKRGTDYYNNHYPENWANKLGYV